MLLCSLLSGCHLFSSGTIDLTCDELGSCDEDTSALVDSADTGAELLLSQGVVLSVVDEADAWMAGVFDPPTLSARFEKGGTGSLAGAAAYSPDRNRMFVAADGALYTFGPSEDSIDKVELPVSEPVHDIQPVDQALFLVTDSWLLHQPAPGAPISVLNDGDNTPSELTGITLGEDGLLYIVDSGSSDGPDVYSIDPESSEPTTIGENIDSNAARVNGDLFIGPDGALMSCSGAGAVYSIDDLISSSKSPEVIAFVSTTIDDVLACGWDEAVGRYLIASGTEGIFATIPGEDDLRLFPAGEDVTALGAYIY